MGSIGTLLRGGMGLLLAVAVGPVAVAGETVFDLEEVSVFESGRKNRGFLRGQRWRMISEGHKIEVLPTFQSENPLFGCACFSRHEDGDECSTTRWYAVDESGGTGTGYDRLYFDLNRDLDLTNDPVLAALSDPPAGALLGYSWATQEVCFESVAIPLDFGPAGERDVEVMPRFMKFSEDESGMAFVATKIRRADIEIAGRPFEVRLGYGASVNGELGGRNTRMVLLPKTGFTGREPHWRGADRLSTTHAVGGEFFRFAATPLGDRLTVTRYDGEVGVFKVAPGRRDIETMTMAGSLFSKETSVAVGDAFTKGWPVPTEECVLPVGDYALTSLSLDYGRLHLAIVPNRHADGAPRQGRKPAYKIRIRKGRPFVLDFSNKPEVLFASPAKRTRVKRGETAEIKAVLTDPSLGIMFRILRISTRNQTGESPGSDGKTPSTKPGTKLEPAVRIVRGDGEVVVEGAMPFRSDSTCEYLWAVPTNLELAGKKETFTIEVTYDTLELYGRVTASRKIVVEE